MTMTDLPASTSRSSCRQLLDVMMLQAPRRLVVEDVTAAFSAMWVHFEPCCSPPDSVVSGLPQAERS